MRKDVANDEKRVPEVVVDYSEELERIMENPDLLVEEDYRREWEEENISGTYDNHGHHSGLHHHRSSSHYSSSHHKSSSYNHSRHSHGSEHQSGRIGRLASHHRSRHHHHSQSESVKQEIVTPVLSDKVTSDVGELAYHDDFDGQSELKKKDSYAEYTPVEKKVEQPDNRSVTFDEVKKSKTSSYSVANERTKRIASKASGSESSKREAERAAESPTEKKHRKKSSRRYNKKKKIGFFGVLVRILLFFVILGIAGVGMLVYLRASGERAMKKAATEVTIEVPQGDPEVEAVEDDGKVITYKGEKYRYNENVSTILFLGSDRTIIQQESNESLIGANGQADTILLGVVDNKNKKISFLSVNRDTMTAVPEYTADDEFAGNKVMQICLAYSYGADNAQSCERMTTAVSNYLYGIPINSYCRLSYDEIPPLNDAIGGVSVKIPEDMTAVNPSWTEGTNVTLQGKDAISFVRWRNTGTVHTNELRMARQKLYLNEYIKQTLTKTRSDFSLPITLYSTATDYMTTDITASKITYLSSKALEYGISTDAIRTVPGESVDGEEHVEFYSDDKALFEIILDLFYNKE